MWRRLVNQHHIESKLANFSVLAGNGICLPLHMDIESNGAADSSHLWRPIGCTEAEMWSERCGVGWFVSIQQNQCYELAKAGHFLIVGSRKDISATVQVSRENELRWF